MKFIFFLVESLINNFLSLVMVFYKNRVYFTGSFKPYKLFRHEKLVVAMNGPSLLEDLDKVDIEADQFLVANHFADLDIFTNIKPNFYVFSDPYFWHQNVTKSLADKREKTFERITELVNWNIVIFLPNNDSFNTISKRLSSNTYVNCVRFNGSGYPFSKASKFTRTLWGLGLFSPFAQNVLIHSLYSAVMLSPKKISIIGANFSFHESIYVDQLNNEFSKIRKHVYGEKMEKAFTDYSETDYAKVSNEFLALYRCYRTLEGVKLLSNDKMIPIINLTENSYLDMFDRNE